VRSLLEGLTNADRIVDLQRRVRLLPTDLNEYFERILFTVDNLYRKETAQMFQITLMARDTLSLINYWFIDQDDPDFLRNLKLGPVEKKINDVRLAQMQKRLNACCKGLLEVQLITPKELRSEFFYLKVDFLHRTVRDFLRIPDMQTMLDKWVGEDFDANTAICEALLAQVKTAPQERFYFQSHGPITGIINMFFTHAKFLEDSQCSLETEVRLLDDLQVALASHMTVVEKAGKFLSSHASVVRDLKVLLSSWARIGIEALQQSDYLVLEGAVSHGLHRYVSKKSDEQVFLPSPVQYGLLVCALVPRADSSSLAPPPRSRRMIDLLLKKGCDPNKKWREKSSWVSFLEDEYRRHQVMGKANDDAFPIIQNLLRHGANPNATCFLGSQNVRHSAAATVRMLITGYEAIELGDLLDPLKNQEVKREVKLDPSRRKGFVNRIFGDREGKRKG